MGLVKHLVVFSLLLALAGCDNKDAEQNTGAEQAETQSEIKVIDNNTTADISNSSDDNDIVQDESSKLAFNPTPELVEKYHGKELTVID
ncbi:MAG: hypothetical protein J6583_12880, partial [Gilliamella sp.]|nr:hypothetical protein [Gilliamella sp.]